LQLTIFYGNIRVTGKNLGMYVQKGKMDTKIIKQTESDIKRIFKHIQRGSDLRDFSDDFDSILGAVGSDKTCGDIIGEDVAYWK